MTETNEFLPADSKAEAVARLYAIAGVPPEPLGPGSTEKKSVLVSLARRFDLLADVRATKPVVGGQIAHALGAEWTPASWSRGSTITLHGLNVLLEAATHEASRRRLLSAVEEAFAERLDIPGFAPARGKLEAVNRISALTHSGAEDLGPGSKERKSVLTNLVVGLGLDLDTSLNKVELGAAIAHRFGVAWGDNAWSTGQTVTLVGLNNVLAGAERLLGALGRPLADTFSSPFDEAHALLAVLDDAITARWDGRACVEEMRAAEYRNWRQTEWAGWYFEYVGVAALINAFGGGPRRVLHTSFDYALRSTWDLKAHSTGKERGAILNDLDAIEAGLGEGNGLGFIVLTGDPDYSDGLEFDAWHRGLRGAGPAHERSRALKSGFTPVRLDAFHLPDASALDLARSQGAYAVMQQGRQPDGAARKPKLKINFAAAMKPLLTRRITRSRGALTPSPWSAQR